MININIKSKTQEIKQLAMHNHIEQALQELLSLSKLTEDKNFQNYVIVNCSNYYDFKRNSLLAIDNNKQAKNKTVLALLELTDEVEFHFHKTQKVQRQSEIEPISEVKLIKLLNLFGAKTSKLYKTNEKELEELYNFKIQLYNQIFQEFDNKLFDIPNVQKHSSSVLFNRIISYEKLEKIDIDTISSIRHNPEFKPHERALIVSALSISTQNIFDSQKLHLLIDFLTDFEDNVWQRAIIGIILSLYPIEGILPFYTDIINRLAKLKEIPQVQLALIDIERILRTGIYRPSKAIENIPDELLLTLLGNAFDINKSIPTDDFIDAVDDDFLRKFINKETIDELLKKEEVNFMEIYKILNLREHLKKNDLNIWGIDFSKHKHFKKPQNWLLSFYENNPVILETIEKSRISGINLKKLTDNLMETEYLDNFEKYSICLDLERYDKDYLIFFENFKDIINYLKTVNNLFVNKDFNKLALIIRELFRYNKFFSPDILNDVFKDKIELYKSELISNLANKNQQLEIIAKATFEEENYVESIKNYKSLINNFPENAKYKSSLAKSYYYNNEYLEAKKIYEELLNKENDLEQKAEYIDRIGNIYDKMENEAKYWELKVKAAEVREKSVERLFKIYKKNNGDDELGRKIVNNSSDIAKSLNIIGVYFAGIRNMPLGFFYLLKSANFRTVRYKSQTNDIEDVKTVYTNLKGLADFFINDKDNTLKLLQKFKDLSGSQLIQEESEYLLLSYFEDMFGAINTYNEGLEKYLDYSLDNFIDEFIKINKDNDIFLKKVETLDFQNKEKLKNSISEIIHSIRETVTPLFEQHSENYKFIVLPLIVNNEMLEIKLNIEKFLKNDNEYFTNEIRKHLTMNFFKKETKNLLSTIDILIENTPNVIDFLKENPNLIVNRKNNEVEKTIINYLILKILNLKFEVARK